MVHPLHGTAPGSFGIDPALKKYMEEQRAEQDLKERRRRFFQMLSQMGQEVMAAGRRGEPLIRGLSAGLARGGYAGGRGGGADDMIEMLNAQSLLDRVRAGQEKRQQQEHRNYARQTLSTGSMPAGPDLLTGIDWWTPRQLTGDIIMADEPAALGRPRPAVPRELALSLPPPSPRGRRQSAVPPAIAQLLPPRGLQGRTRWGGPTEERALAIEAYPEAAGRAQAAEIFGAPKAPTTRTVKRGDQFITEEWQPGAGWTEVGRGPRFSPTEGGSLTLAQSRENAEIKQARAALDREGLSHEDVMRISKSQRDTGRNNLDYSPFINSRVRQATRRMYGDDPDYAATYGRYLTPAPEMSEPAGMRPLPPGANVEPASLLRQSYEALFGVGDAAGQSTPRGNGAPPYIASQQRRGRYPRPGRPGQAPRTAIPQMSITEIDDLIEARGDSLSPTELQAIQARLAALGAR